MFVRVISLLTALPPALYALLSSSPAHAQMVLDKIEVELGAERRYDDIEITNLGTEPLYIQIAPSRIQHPGRPDEKRISPRDPESLGLLVTPMRLIVQPRERHRVRIVALNPQPVLDEVFRVAIKPVVGSIESDQTAAVKVVVAYDVLVLVRPADANADIQSRRTGHVLMIENLGNSCAVLHDGRQCDASQQDCRTLPAQRLYAGGKFRVELPFDTPATYTVRFRGDMKTRTF
ncbi:hypothetical protein ACG33_07370 [Steroidobacter denitrificans]|uniref:Pili assembly chaperone N-terminal domain-containing protein n=1 Tax=Steroidobacter denitrificans TaxID=465721 RepID=A0A127F939_STEDE|nr:fimbria/pilus periplasmic chaperone [Steroidobacter denitrificans]AMN46917.1 hypothetical protein ACG33_07370 [Steroidobacter denitrificans]